MGAVLSIAFTPGDAPARYWPIAVAAAVLPDADFLLFYFRYYPTLGHRGFFHSPFLGLIISFPLDTDPGFADGDKTLLQLPGMVCTEE